jgi:putative SOS response-associated peptidase YedK
LGKTLRTVSNIIVATDTGVWRKDVVDGSMPAGPRYSAYRAIITTAANGVVKPVHDRMPVILDPVDYGQWLDPRAGIDDLVTLLWHFPEAMTSRMITP